MQDQSSINGSIETAFATFQHLTNSYIIQSQPHRHHTSTYVSYYVPYPGQDEKDQAFQKQVSFHTPHDRKKTHNTEAPQKPSAAMATERDFQVAPIVPESVMHNTKAYSNLQTLTASIFGAAAGILGLESYGGFLFYVVFTFLTTALFYAIRVAPTSLKAGHSVLDTSRYFRTGYEFWAGGLLGGLAGYILTWTLFYGLVRA
ncbi:Rab5-interacting protein-domain-containing protein [Xylariomycetidae sp. FL2044]|nr:Rab5-interacting protein-domain-containing protein [Xylariomycetidae sp. FL2044]